jgi:N-acetyl-1-D-myo-inositol-2-amino-2-deoxy-alpha-D-glucopyranoside deacetylase
VPGRLLAVHAHPDDESITMGGTMSVLAERGVQVANVCCTDGELATIVAADMPEEEYRPRLGEVRRAELQRACAILGVAEVHLLGYHDSGMAGEPTSTRPEAFFMQPLDAVAERLTEIIRAFRPHVVVTYDAYGSYGHPDHIQTHRATLIAVEAARRRGVYPKAGEPWEVAKLYYTAFPISVLARAIEVAAAAGREHPFDGRPPEELEFATPDRLVTASLDVRSGIDRKLEALRAHHSQIDESFLMMFSGDLFTEEHYQLAVPRAPAGPPETDLFAGVATED